jgi:predicted aspartyl protease
MGSETMGKVLVSAKIENLADRFLGKRGLLTPEQVRHVEVSDALVDTGATPLCMPKRLIEQLGLQHTGTRQARTSAGTRTVQVYEAVRLTVQGRDCPSIVTELPDDSPVLIGRIPLHLLDLVVDPNGQRLIGNPAHGGEHIIELY